jgi:hypothetical protein
MTWTTLCCKNRGCPRVKVDGEILHIKDDLGGTIQITLAEFRDIDRWVGETRADAQKPSDNEGSKT